MNEGTEGRTDVVPGRLDASLIPVVGVGFALGRRIAAEAQDRGQDGAAGINDNASGSAAVLETALTFARGTARPTRRVRFAFWGAEEVGLVGSRHHVDALPEERRREIVLYINLDMVGSPNFGRFVQGARADGDGLAAMASQALVGAFRSRGLAVEVKSGHGSRGYGSDDASFARHGIPTVGLHTGASERKPDDEAALFGGAGGEAYDPCYHRACDTAANVDRAVLRQMTEALARAVAALTDTGEAPDP